MNTRTFINCAFALAISTLAGCGGGSGPVAKLKKDMVPIPGQNYAMCKYEVTKELWEAVMGMVPTFDNNPNSGKTGKTFRIRVSEEFTGPNLPVEQVSWEDCQKFLAKLNALPEVRKSGYTYRLPTAFEWAYACRGGSTGDYCKLADGTEITKETLETVAWYAENGGAKTHAVGQKKPNAFGLYDMLGNVGEWTSTGDGDGKILCGSSWSQRDIFCLSGLCASINPESCRNNIGLRLAADVDAGATNELPSEMIPVPGVNYYVIPAEASGKSANQTNDGSGNTVTSDLEVAVEGVHYYTGEEVEKDIEKGLALLRKSAKAGCAFGQYMLGLALLDQGGPKNESEAVKWLEKAVESGMNDKNDPDDDEKWIDDARLYLGVCYVEGKGLPPGANRMQYDSKGRELLAIAALRGHEEASKVLELLPEP